MTDAAAAFGLICAILIGAIFHLAVGGSLRRLLLYLSLSILGFAAGHLIGLAQSWTLIPLGPLNFGAAVIGSIIFLGVGYWLSLVRTRDLRD